MSCGPHPEGRPQPGRITVGVLGHPPTDWVSGSTIWAARNPQDRNQAGRYGVSPALQDDDHQPQASVDAAQVGEGLAGFCVCSYTDVPPPETGIGDLTLAYCSFPWAIRPRKPRCTQHGHNEGRGGRSARSAPAGPSAPRWPSMVASVRPAARLPDLAARRAHSAVHLTLADQQGVACGPEKGCSRIQLILRLATDQSRISPTLGKSGPGAPILGRRTSGPPRSTDSTQRSPGDSPGDHVGPPTINSR